jgi:hypothetical protein
VQIAPYYSDATLNNPDPQNIPGVNLWWRMSTDGADVASASAQIQATFPATAVGFTPTNVIIATWCVWLRVQPCKWLGAVVTAAWSADARQTWRASSPEAMPGRNRDRALRCAARCSRSSALCTCSLTS